MAKSGVATSDLRGRSLADSTVYLDAAAWVGTEDFVVEKCNIDNAPQQAGNSIGTRAGASFE